MRISRLLLSMLLAALVVTGLSPASAPAAPTTPTLVGIRVGHHPGFDRVVFDFDGGLPSETRVGYVDELVGDGSGLPIRISGRAILQVGFTNAVAHDDDSQTAPARRAFALPNVMTAVRSGDFEGVVTYGLGLAKRARYTMFTLRQPDRVVLDIRATFPTVNRKVWFLNQKRYLANKLPFFTPVIRPVRSDARAVGLMDRIFAGPLPAEHRAGLRLLRSRASGWTDLTIARRVARVQLVGGCSSGGSTVTVAGEIMPTLRQLKAVDWIKIYDPEGTTLTPRGHVDSVPECLEP